MIELTRAHASDLLAARETRSAWDWMKRVFGVIRAKQRVRRRVYFISYSSEDRVWANEIAMLLRRRDRGVLRDEINLKPGGKLEVEIAQFISESDDVLVVDSANAARSQWVPIEIRLAMTMRETSKGRAPKRIFGILLDGAPPKTALDPRELHLNGRNPAELDVAVARAVDSES